jgi:uncharacterized protein YfbU (UPF0304 family)
MDTNFILNEYVFDFERINELTTNINDRSSTNNYSPDSNIVFQISRKIVKEYIEIINDSILNKRSKVDEDRIQFIINCLEFNGILINKKKNNRKTKISDVLNNF